MSKTQSSPGTKARSKVKMSPELASRVTPEKIEAAQQEVEKPKKRNTAWKSLEYAVAEVLRKAGFKKAKRYPKSDQMAAMSGGQELPDVNIPEAPFLQLDAKYSQKSWDKVEKLFLDCEVKYALKPEDRFAMITQKAGSRHKLVHLRLDWFAELCAKAYLGGKTSDVWTCPQCRAENLNTKEIGMGQELHSCGVCLLEFITKSNTRPKS